MCQTFTYVGTIWYSVMRDDTHVITPFADRFDFTDDVVFNIVLARTFGRLKRFDGERIVTVLVQFYKVI